jgi:hypothetical protein
MAFDPLRPEESIERVLGTVETLTAWPDGIAPKPREIFTPWSHGRIFDLDRALVVGNRGVGKTFWSNALVNAEARKIATSAYPRTHLESVGLARFGYQAGVPVDGSPSKESLQQALAAGIKPEMLWLAVSLRALNWSGTGTKRLVDFAREVANDPDKAHRRMRDTASKNDKHHRRDLLVFDGLDRLGDSWEQILPLTEGLFRFAISMRGVKGLALKIFVRPDQLLDPRVKAFPDASKLLSERVDLRWRPADLYGLLFFHLWKHDDSRKALEFLAERAGFDEMLIGSQLPFQLRNVPSYQKKIFSEIAGEWMGNDKKRGSTYSWLPLHLADARDETSPRSFLKAISVAAGANSKVPGLAFDFTGIKEGVVAASEVRIAELSEDYWWISRALQPLKGIIVPCERDLVFDCWESDGTANAIRRAARSSNLLTPLLFNQNSSESEDLEALLLTLREIAVVEIRTNLKINIPDIFRVGAGIKRRGGVRPPKRQ